MVDEVEIFLFGSSYDQRARRVTSGRHNLMIEDEVIVIDLGYSPKIVWSDLILNVWWMVVSCVDFHGLGVRIGSSHYTQYRVYQVWSQCSQCSYESLPSFNCSRSDLETENWSDTLLPSDIIAIFLFMISWVTSILTKFWCINCLMPGHWSPSGLHNSSRHAGYGPKICVSLDRM